MPRWLQVTLHAVLIGSNVALAFHGAPPEVVGGIAALQGAISYAAQAYNTDGTPQSVPFQKP
jgi:hypothetical protein